MSLIRLQRALFSCDRHGLNEGNSFVADVRQGVQADETVLAGVLP